MDSGNCLSLFKELCTSFLLPSQEETISEHDVNKLFRKTLSNVFVKFKNDMKESDDPVSLLKTEIISNVIARESNFQNHFEEINKYHTVVEEIYKTSEDQDEINAMFLLLCKLSQLDDPVAGVHRTDDSPTSFFGGSFNGSNWNVFHEDPGPICNPFDYPFYAPFGTGLKLIQDYCRPIEPLSNDFFKIYDGQFKLYRFDLNQPVKPAAHDEGFITPGSDYSAEFEKSSEHSVFSAMSTSCSSDEPILDSMVLKLSKKTWEYLGNDEYIAELPMASEHLESVLHLWKLFNASPNQSRLNNFPIEDRAQCSFNELKTDLFSLLFGMNSSSFFYNIFTKTFYIRDKLHTRTLTPEIVSAVCEPFLCCASYYQALKIFIEQRSNLSFGPTHQVFCRSLNEVLNIYRHSLLNLNWDSICYVGQLEPLITPFRRKLQFLVRFCLITLGEKYEGSNFPSGVQLLNYLYDNLMKVSRSDFSCILFHLFQKCCNMYFKIVSEWIFNGCFSNSANYAEFFIEIQQIDELRRDWRRVSCIKMKEKLVPKFLETFFKEIFVCGKSVNLLKVFTSRDVLNAILPKGYPSIKCCFNKKQLDLYVLDWQRFEETNNVSYSSQKKMKNILVKTYEPEFYANVKRIRDEWFTNYEKNFHQKEISSKKSENASTELDIIPELNLSCDEALAETLDETNVEKIVIQDDDVITVETQEEKPMLKTKKLVEFYEQLNSRASTPEKSPKNSPKICMHPAEIVLKHEAENIDVCMPPDSKLASHHSSEIISNTDVKTEACSEKSTPLNNAGGGDFLPSTVSAAKSLHVPGACGDASNCIQLADDTPQQENLSAVPVQISDFQRNRLRSLYSDHQNQLNIPEKIPSDNRNNSTPLTIRQRNRMKSMSSNQFAPVCNDDSIESQITVSTPLNVRDQNKLKVMSSEYHQRLNIREKPLSNTDLCTTENQRELSEYERNKLKVMSSEYHLRLMDCVNHNAQIEKKLGSHNSTELTDREVNKCRVMASEFYVELKESELVVPSPSSALPEAKEEAESVSCSTSVDEIVEGIDTISEDIESEEQMTVVENVHDSFLSPSEFVDDENSVSIPQPAMNDVLNVERYISYHTVVFARHNVNSTSKIAVESIQDVDRTSFLYYLSQSIMIPLKIQSKIVNESILRVFIEEEDYLEHLNTLRNYFLLRKSEFSAMLTNSMFKMMECIKKPYLLLNNYTLSSLLQQALLAGNSRESIRFERKLFFLIDDVIPQTFDSQDIKALKCVSLNFSIKWPVNVLLTEPIMKKYSIIFKFLMQLQRASWTLKNDFKRLKNLKRGKSIQYTQIQLYRHNMTQVVRILQEFIMRESIERCWNELVEYMTSSEISLDGLYLSHLKYVNKILQRCFLCDLSATCHESVLNLLSSVLQYHVAVRNGAWHRNVQVNFLYHTNFRNIQTAFEQFQQNLNDVRTKLKLLVYTKQRSYFEPLLFELSRDDCII